MLRLLNIELQKIRYNKSAKVITIVYFVLITFIALIASIEFNFGDFNFRVADQGIFNFPFIWHFNSFMAAILKIFLAVVIVSMMSNEYSYRTLKQNLIDGLSKKEFVLSKFLTVILFAVISTLFLKLVTFFSFCLFLGVLVKRSAFALGFLIIWFIIEKIIYGLLEWEFFRGTDIADNISQFFPLEAMSNLIKEPFTRLGAVQSAANQLGDSFTKTYDVELSAVVIVLVWTFLFIYWSYAILKRRDL